MRSIGLSVVDKAFEESERLSDSVWFWNPTLKLMVLMFGLVHGFGLATKLQDLHLSTKGLVGNLVSFNVGVELGQLIALSIILLAMTWWRSTSDFVKHAVAANVVVMMLGFLLIGYQLTGYYTGRAA